MEPGEHQPQWKEHGEYHPKQNQVNINLKEPDEYHPKANCSISIS